MNATIRDLPGSIRPVAEVIGVLNTLKIAEVFGRPWPRGRGRLHVPTSDHLSPNHRLSQLLGYESASKLCATFGGESLVVPHCANALRRAEIWADYMAGLSEATIAVKYALTERRIRQITAEERGPTPEGFHARIAGAGMATRLAHSPDQAQLNRLNGLLGGRSAVMLRRIIQAIHAARETPYGHIVAAIQGFRPTFVLAWSEDKSMEIDLSKAVELLAARLPAEFTVKHGDLDSMMLVKPAKASASKTPLMIQIKTPVCAKTLTQNGFICSALVALAHAAAIDKMAQPPAPVSPAKVTEDYHPSNGAWPKS